MSVDRVKQLYQTANLTYTRSVHRATPYLLGVSLGYLLHRTDRNTHIPKVSTSTYKSSGYRNLTLSRRSLWRSISSAVWRREVWLWNILLHCQHPYKSGWSMNDELKRIRKKEAVSLSRNYSCLYLETLRKITKNPQDSRSPDLHSNRDPFECKSRLLLIDKLLCSQNYCVLGFCSFFHIPETIKHGASERGSVIEVSYF